MEFSHLNVVVVIVVNLTEDFVQSESTLVNDLEQVVKDLILGVMVISVLLLVDCSLNIVFVHKRIELIILDNSVLVLVNLLEECSDFVLFETHVKVA
jgi:hypothetical protein